MEITIFRIVQESLTNIHRHSGSQTANVKLTRQPNQVTLEITDQGKGFVVPTESESVETAARLGVGILGMRERVRQFGGNFAISSRDSGTTTVVTLPVEISR
jgi:two-component system, NarL family, sensor kinase